MESKTETFNYNYSAEENKEINKIREKYLPKKEETQFEKLIKLDKQVENSGKIEALTLGVIGSLILGVGMCLVMVWNTSTINFVLGIIIGLVGMVIAGLAYPTYNKIKTKEKVKVTEEILKLTEELMIK